MASSPPPRTLGVAPAALPHPVYYFDDGNLFFRIGSTLFRLHRSLFRIHSQPFYDLVDGMGGTETDPIDLSDGQDSPFRQIAEKDFVGLLSVIYPIPITFKPPASDSQWISLLKASSSLLFDTVRRVAIKHIVNSSLPPGEKLLLTHEYDIQEMKSDVYLELCLRPAPLTLREARVFRISTLNNFYHIRESIRSQIIDHVSAWKCEGCWGGPNGFLQPGQGSTSPTLAAYLANFRTPCRSYCTNRNNFIQMVTKFIDSNRREWKNQLYSIPAHLIPAQSLSHASGGRPTSPDMVDQLVPRAECESYHDGTNERENLIYGF